MITAGEFRNGRTFEHEGNVFQIVEFQHVKPGKGAAFVRTKLKNIISGGVVEKTFRPTEKFEEAHIDRKDMAYSYGDDDFYHFMDNETFDMLDIAKSEIEEQMKFVKENDVCKVMFMNNFPHHQFILCTSGTGKICTENNIEQTVSKGDIVFINSSILFSLRQQENFSIKRIAFNGNFVTNYLQYFDFNQSVVFVPKSDEVFNAFNIAYDGYMHDKDDIQNSVNMYNLIGVCGESYVSSKPTLLTPEDFIAESGFDFIKQNISSINIDFSPYLKLHKISITELNDIFISRYGKNINELIYFYRMEFAKYAVFKVGNTHYERYYNQCGFKSPQEFYSEFKKYANMTVEEYLNLVWAK